MSVNPSSNGKLVPLNGPYVWLAWLFVVIVAVGPRVVDLDVFFARDELAIWPWADEFALAIWNGDLAGTLTDSDYPGIPMFWAQTAFLTFKYTFPGMFPNTQLPVAELLSGRSLELLAERRLAGALFVSLQIILVVWLVRRLFGWTVALLAAIFLGLDPFSLSEARVLRLEMISALFVGLTVLSYFGYLCWRRRRWVLLSGVMAGLGVSSKTSAGLVVPYIWLLLLLDLLLANRSAIASSGYLATRPFKRVIVDGLIWAGGAVGAFWLIWPAMWVKPVEAVQYVYQAGFAQAADRSVWGDKVFFWGQIFPGDPGPFFYPVALAFRTTPLTWIGAACALVLVGISIFHFKRSEPNPAPRWTVISVLLLLAFIILIIIELSFVISKVDRFLLIVFPALNILSAIGLATLIGWLGDRLTGRLGLSPKTRSAFITGAILVTLVIQFMIMFPTHPYYFSYWNPWAGGGRAAMTTVPLGAGEGIDLAMDFLNKQLSAAETTLICGASKPWCEGKFVGTTLRSATYASGEWVTADYASFYISHLQRQSNPAEVVDFFAAREPLYQVELQGATYMSVYEVPDMGHFAGPWNDLAGLARLLGYDFGPPNRKAGDTVEAMVWWVNMGAGVDNLVVRLVDRAGYEWSQSQVMPRPEYASIPADQRAVVAGTATVSLPPSVPPGLYFWKLGVISADNGQLLGEFQMPDQTNQLVIAPGPGVSDPELFDIATPTNQMMAPDIVLLGYTPPDQVITSKQPAWLTLFWQATAPPTDYDILLRLLDRAGQELFRWQGKPVQSQYATQQWQPGQIVQDVWPLQVAPDTPVGQYSLEISLIEPATAKPDPDYGPVTIPNLEVWTQPLSYDLSDMPANLQAKFGEHLTLLGYELYFDTNGAGENSLSPVLYWQSRQDFEAAFDLLLTLRAADSGEVLQEWQLPLGNDRPKTFWKANEIVTTIYQLEVGTWAEAGYHLDIALKNQKTGQIEPVILVDGTETTFVRIENIQDEIVVRITDQ